MLTQNVDLNNKTILVTGAAGFIGFHLSKRILEEGGEVIGFDNLNDYYEVSLKKSRLEILEKYEKFTFIKGNLADKSAIEDIFETFAISICSIAPAEDL